MADGADGATTADSLAFEELFLLESMYPPGSTDRQKEVCVLRLLQIALQPEHDGLNGSVDRESARNGC